MADDVNYWTNVFWRKMSRRGFIKAAAVSGVAFGVGGALGCQQGEQPSASKTPVGAAQPKRGGTFVFPHTTEPVHLDAQMRGNGIISLASAFVYNTLIRTAALWDDNGYLAGAEKFYPEIAESWEQPEPTTYVFKLQKGFKFQNLPPVNGREVTAEDVRWSIERIRTPKPEFGGASYFESVQSVDVVDNYTIRFKLKEPFVSFLNILGDSWTVIAPKELVARDGDLKRSAIGSGAFILDKQTTGVSLDYKRNPDYFFKDEVYLDGIKYQLIKDKGTSFASFRAGDIDRLSVIKDDLQQVKQGQPDIYTWLRHSGRVWIFLNNAKPPFDDVNLRRACVHATNHQEFYDILWGGDAMPSGPVPSHVKPWALPDSEIPKFDLKLAKEYMAKSKYPNGVKVLMEVAGPPNNQADVGAIAQRHWKQIGVDLELKMIDTNTSYVKLFNRDFAIFTSGDELQLDPTDGLNHYLHSKAGKNFINYNNPEFDRLVEEQQRELNETKRIDLVHKAQRVALQDAASVFLGSSRSYIVNRNYVKGLKQWFLRPGQGDLAGGTFLFRGVWLDK